MKKFGKFLPLFLAAPLLVGCGNNKKVEKPKFADVGTKVELDKFLEDFQKARESCEFAKEDKVGSFELKFSSRITSNYSVTRGKKAVEKNEESYWADMTVQYDSANVLMSAKGKGGAESVREDPRSKSVEKASNVTNDMAQAGQVNGANYVVTVNNKDKTYSPLTLLDKDVTAADALDLQAKDGVMEMGGALDELIQEYYYSSDEKKEKFSFYNNNNVYTIEYNSPGEDVEQKDSDDEVYRVDNESDYRIAQVDFTNGKMAFRYYGEEKSKTVYKKAVEGHAVSDVIEREQKSAQEATTETKSVKLKAVDVKKYTAVGFELEE